MLAFSVRVYQISERQNEKSFVVCYGLQPGSENRIIKQKIGYTIFFICSIMTP